MAFVCLELHVPHPNSRFDIKNIAILMLFCSKLIALAALGYRMEAIGILGREVLQPRGLIGLGCDSLDHCGPEIADVSTLSSSSSPFNYKTEANLPRRSEHSLPSPTTAFWSTARRAKTAPASSSPLFSYCWKSPFLQYQPITARVKKSCCRRGRAGWWRLRVWG